MALLLLPLSDISLLCSSYSCCIYFICHCFCFSYCCCYNIFLNAAGNVFALSCLIYNHFLYLLALFLCHSSYWYCIFYIFAVFAVFVVVFVIIMPFSLLIWRSRYLFGFMTFFTVSYCCFFVIAATGAVFPIFFVFAVVFVVIIMFFSRLTWLSC